MSYNRLTMISLLLLLPLVSGCRWPTVDVLFILDSTYNVDQYQHRQQLDFVRQAASHISISDPGSRVGLAQFTPLSRLEFGFADGQTQSTVQDKLNQVLYQPCDSTRSECRPVASLNSVAKNYLVQGNRKWIPDVIVSISSSRFEIPEITDRETLLSPISPIHSFQIVVDGNYQREMAHFEPSATSLRMGAVDFNALGELIDPLCESVNTFVGNSNHSVFGPLCWTVAGILIGLFLLCLLVFFYAIYSYRNENSRLRYKILQSEKTLRSQNEYFTAKLHTQMEDHIKAGQKHTEDILKQQESIKTQQLELQRHLINSTTPSPQVHQPQPIIIYPANGQNHAGGHNHHTHGHNGHGPDHGHSGAETHRPAGNHPEKKLEISNSDPDIRVRMNGDEVEVTNGRVSTRLTHENSKNPNSVTLQLSRKEPSEELNDTGIPYPVDPHNGHPIGNRSPRNRNHGGHHHSRPGHGPHISHLDLGASTAERHWRNNSDPHYISDETSSSEDSSDSAPSIAKIGHLPRDHPARTLPPIDIMFLVDSSSSIGITNFDAIKVNINNVLDDIDISPGRSRVSLVQYAQEPSVVFGFEKYYSLENVKRSVNRMSYTGGSTMLAKALSFASGILYKEQNLKDPRKKHKLMPTPRHDRLQILCVVSDGASDDNIDRATNYLHERLQVKVMAMVSKSFNKDKLTAITRFEGSVFVMTQKESISIWMWRQQKLWADNYGSYLEREKSTIPTKRSRKE